MLDRIEHAGPIASNTRGRVEVARRVANAPLRELLIARTRAFGPALEVLRDECALHQGAPCPECQEHGRIDTGAPAARVGELTWECLRCGKRGTIFDTIAAVLLDPDVLQAFLVGEGS